MEFILGWEMNEHLTYAKHGPTGRGSGNSCDGTLAKTVMTDSRLFRHAARGQPANTVCLLGFLYGLACDRRCRIYRFSYHPHFLREGIDVVVLDDFSTGRDEFVPVEAKIVRGSLLDPKVLECAFSEGNIDGVIHVAGYKYAGVSVQRPLHTYRQNVEATVNLLEGMKAAGVNKMVFSSSASVYGTPDVLQVTEDCPKRPESPYGQTKLIGEWLMADCVNAWGLKYTNLRYFNVVGSGYEDIYDVSPHNLFPLVFRALAEGKPPKIFGSDYDTPDGTCVRDYVHVADLARAHVEAAKRLESGEPVETAYNLGSSDGASVAQIMDAVSRITGIEFTPELAPRRPGDPARIVANGNLAARDLGWKMTYDLDGMVETAWKAHQRAETR